MKPRITALMTTFNAEKWVDDTIISVLNQTYSDFEFLVIDDGSSDNTVRRVKSYSDKRIKLIENEKNVGVGACLDSALKVISTDYIVKIDADDISDPRRFEKQLGYLEANNLAVVKCFVTYFPDSEDVKNSPRYKQFISEKQNLLNEVTTPEQIASTLDRWLCILHTSYFALTSAIKHVRYPHTRLYEDYVLFLRLKNAGYRFGCVNEPLVHIRLSDTSTTNALGLSDLEKGLEGIINEKWPNFNTIVQDKSVYVFGTGNMAKACANYLNRVAVTVNYFVEKTTRPHTIRVEDEEIGIVSLDNYLASNEKRVLIIAAQPVRNEIADKLESVGMSELEDFLILA